MPEEYKPVEIPGKLRPELKEALRRLNAELASKYFSQLKYEQQERFAEAMEKRRIFWMWEEIIYRNDTMSDHKKRENYGHKKAQEREKHGKEAADKSNQTRRAGETAVDDSQRTANKGRTKRRGRGRRQRISVND